MRALNNGKPQLTASDKTRDVRNRVIYADAKSTKTAAKNYDGSIVYDTANNGVKNYRSYELFMATNYGYNLCNDCSGVCTTVPDPDIQTENNIYSRMIFSGDTLIGVGATAGADYLSAPMTNFDGAGVYIDPSGALFGTTTCTRMNYLTYMKDLSGVDLSGNDTNQNYLKCVTFPSNVRF